VISTLLFVLSAIALGHALQINNGFYDYSALKWVTAALALCGAGVACLRAQPRSPRRWRLAVCITLAVGIIWQLITLSIARPGFYLDADPDYRILRICIAAEAVMIALGIAGVRRAARIWFPAVLALNLALGVWMMKASPHPWIDVVTVHKAAIEALLQHEDPYRISFENIYGDEAKNFYNPAAIAGRRIAFGYPYPPVSLLFAVPGQVLFGDFRYAQLAALIAAAALIGRSAEGLAPKLAACLLLTTPRGLFVLEQGWTEPIALLLLAATVFLMPRRPLVGAWVGGLMIFAKQYLFLAGPPFLRYALGQRRRDVLPILGFAGLAAAAATLPFALWHPNSFMNNVIWLQTREPFRTDSLSYLSWAARQGWGQGTFWWAVGAACLAMVVSLLSTPNTAAGLCASITLYSLALFAFGSKAFCNYYYFVIGALCCTAALCAARLDTEASPPGSWFTEEKAKHDPHRAAPVPDR
jgi:hypothetical protein